MEDVARPVTQRRLSHHSDSSKTGSEDVSCRNLAWTFELCDKLNIDLSRVTRDVGYSIAHLQDASRFIDWENYTTFVSNVGRYLTESELLDAGRNSWNTGTLKIYSYIGRLLFNVKDQYLELFGPLGALAKSYPFEVSVDQLAPQQLRIFLTMNPGCIPCYTFHMVLAGQMIGLPESLGYPPATVEVKHLENGASFDISYGNQRGILAPLRKAALWMFTARQTAKELTSTYESLLEKYREIQEEAQKLKLAELKVKDSDERYRLIANNVNDIIWTMDMDFNIQFVSPAVRGITGYTEDEITSMSLQDLLTESSMENAVDLLKIVRSRSFDPQQLTSIELQLRHKKGIEVWVEIRANIINDSRDVATLIGVARDITERKSMEGEISEHEDSYQAITNTAQDAIITLDKNNVITFANPASVHIFGYQIAELIGKDATRLMPEALGSAHLKELFRQRNGEPRSGVSLKALQKNHTLIPLEMSFASHEFRGEYFRTCIIRDVSVRNEIEQERKQLEQQLLASQKMESIGQLTGGIAHDFNNLLVAILGYADLAMSSEGESSDIQQYLSEIKLAGERAADMTQKLLAFSRRQIIEPELINTNNLILGLELLIDRLIPENINVIFDLEERDLNVMVDSGQLEQVVINLAVNARDAMPKGGILKIGTCIKNVDQRFVSQNPFAREGDFAVINVVDSGEGMSEKIRKRVFEPFFTTKPEGSGTGLGLSVVFGIVKQHEGFIDVISDPGIGTEFAVYLPLSQQETTPAPPEISRTIMGGNETIFIVEDNIQVRNLARLILIGAGYQVLEAEDGIDALHQFETYKDEIDLVVMDVVMPRLGGKDVMEQMLKERPDIKIIFTSGYSASGIHTNFILEEGLEFIAKPYSTDVLRARVRAVLDGEQTRPVATTI